MFAIFLVCLIRSSEDVAELLRLFELMLRASSSMRSLDEC